MNNPKNPKLGHNKKTFLEKPVEHIDITSFDSRKIIESMDKMSFTSRDTARASSIFNEMLSDKNCTTFLTLAGSTSAAGCMKIYSDMIKYNMVDVIVATGASIIDMDFFEALGFKHYQGSQHQDDVQLRENYIDRIYDTYIDEEQLQACDKTICDIADNLEPKPPQSITIFMLLKNFYLLVQIILFLMNLIFYNLTFSICSLYESIFL